MPTEEFKVLRTGQKRATILDAEIGRRIELHRRAKNVSQVELGRALNVSFQQVQKYEKGASRVSTGRLIEIADSLGVDIKAFFTGLSSGIKKIK